MKKQSITVCLIAKDEEKNIGRCLKSLKWADEIVVVVDSRTSDKTAEIAKSHGARVFTEKWRGYDGQRNFATEKANGDWVLSLDADEIVPEKLAVEIQKTITEKKDYSGFYLPRMDYMHCRWIRHGGWYPQYRLVLYRKDEGIWQGKLHEKIKFKVRTPQIGYLKNHLEHYSHTTISKTIQTMNEYSSLEAESLYHKHGKIGMLELLIRMASESFAQFLARFFLWRGFLDGFHGLILASNRAIYKFFVYVKLFELLQKNQRKD